MNHETFEFLYHRGMTLFAVAAGYWWGRVSSRELRWPYAVSQIIAGLLVAGVSHLIIGSQAMPWREPVFFFGIWGVSAVVTSHTMRLGLKGKSPKTEDQEQSKATV